VDEVLAGLNNSPDEKYRMKTETLAKGMIVHQKLIFDNDHRLLVTIGVMRACRFWDYHFVALTPMPTLIEEMIHLERLPGCIDLLPQLRNQLPTYKTIAEVEVQQPKQKDLWIFWVANMLNLDHWYLGAEYIALIQPSSGCSERIFALLISMFGDTQQSALEDRREATVMIRANDNFREIEKKQFEE
jgi:hypothetical protein